MLITKIKIKIKKVPISPTIRQKKKSLNTILIPVVILNFDFSSYNIILFV